MQQAFWGALRNGASKCEASVAAGVSYRTGRRWYLDGGGVASVDSSEPSGRYLSLAEREDIAVWRGQISVREIARRLDRSPSTISRELARNSHAYRPNRYRPSAAHARARVQARRPKTAKLAHDGPLRDYVSGNLVCDERWSPEQIANRIRLDFPDDEGMRISHEAIYQSLYVQGRGALRRELTACLRTGRAMRKPQQQAGERRTRIKDMVMISERPAEVADRAVPGHWEGDLITGATNSSAIGTLVERTTRFTMLLHLPDDHGAGAVRDAIASTITTLPLELRRSLTWDQGSEMAQHVRLSVEADLPVFFCDPRSPWQRGSNENINGLLRQYFPKGTDLSVHPPDELTRVAAGLNGRPRKTLGWKTPAEAFAELLSTTITGGVATTA